MIIFKWDSDKAKKNILNHKITFEEASTVFKDPLSIKIDDPLHSDDETRSVLIGSSHKNCLLVIVHADHYDHIRIISARKAQKKERKYYESNVK